MKHAPQSRRVYSARGPAQGPADSYARRPARAIDLRAVGSLCTPRRSSYEGVLEYISDIRRAGVMPAQFTINDGWSLLSVIDEAGFSVCPGVE
jgi:hypothetical protein